MPKAIYKTATVSKANLALIEKSIEETRTRLAIWQAIEETIETNLDKPKGKRLISSAKAIIAARGLTNCSVSIVGSKGFESLRFGHSSANGWTDESVSFGWDTPLVSAEMLKTAKMRVEGIAECLQRQQKEAVNVDQSEKDYREALAELTAAIAKLKSVSIPHVLAEKILEETGNRYLLSRI